MCNTLTQRLNLDNLIHHSSDLSLLVLKEHRFQVLHLPEGDPSTWRVNRCIGYITKTQTTDVISVVRLAAWFWTTWLSIFRCTSSRSSAAWAWCLTFKGTSHLSSSRVDRRAALVHPRSDKYNAEINIVTSETVYFKCEGTHKLHSCPAFGKECINLEKSFISQKNNKHHHKIGSKGEKIIIYKQRKASAERYIHFVFSVGSEDKQFLVGILSVGQITNNGRKEIYREFVWCKLLRVLKLMTCPRLLNL